MTATPGAARYREADVLTMTPGQRVVLLYTHLVLQLRQARGAIERGDIPARAGHVGRAMDVLHELLFSLDRAAGPLADQLASLYLYLINELAAVSRQPAVARLDPVIRIATELHGAWASAAQSTGASSA